MTKNCFCTAIPNDWQVLIAPPPSAPRETQTSKTQRLFLAPCCICIDFCKLGNRQKLLPGADGQYGDGSIAILPPNTAILAPSKAHLYFDTVRNALFVTL